MLTQAGGEIFTLHFGCSDYNYEWVASEVYSTIHDSFLVMSLVWSRDYCRTSA